MGDANGQFRFLRNRYARVLTGVLVLQAILFYALSRREGIPISKPLSEFPEHVGAWRLVAEGVIDKEVLDVLKADDTLNRLYARDNQKVAANLFVAYFKSQRTGQAPHSPKNCLPGAGWTPSNSGFLTVPVPGEASPIQVNRYVVARGDQKSVVLYWYQTRDRVVASEFMAKIYLVLDSIRYHRSDTALVRVVVPVAGNREDEATAGAVDFVRSFFGPLRRHLPS